MIKEEVCIVLNEREPAKASAAAALESELKSCDISSSRIEIGPNLFDVLKKRNPRFIILDYLLGDFTTGLDVLQNFRKNQESEPSFLFLTDEPSVPVAVQAMKLGALDYFEIERTQSIKQIVSRIKEVRSAGVESERRPNPPVTRLSDLVLQSKPSQMVAKEIKMHLAQREPILVISGPDGSGKKTLARALAFEKGSNTAHRELDLRYYEGTWEDLFGHPRSSRSDLQLGRNLSVTIHSAEADDGGLIDFITKERRIFWPNWNGGGLPENSSFLTIITTDPDVKKSWKALSAAAFITLSELKQRQDDVLPLVQRFWNDAGAYVKGKTPVLDAQIAKKLCQMEWPGNISQLRATIFEAVILGAEKGSGDTEELIDSARAQWERDHTCEPQSIDPIKAALNMDATNHSYRISAARLGCSIQDLRRAMAEIGDGA